eukprot:CAMPEP_0206183026 /NCGR_PEP_ID=MMETSP0166-20121206/400_1 /ASSEMBLY_ACC=CAM_ASM_000260 /TAXON_ID=95228 /ORGANISM="Vannella robusta, Strain DIVA3 518/3/11/1/6" /LENGTH=79 /DNA_ID=CAMNT_0053597817 /DNA_START=76 /DNA_END=315 /DNA_ORIENTATION=-
MPVAHQQTPKQKKRSEGKRKNLVSSGAHAVWDFIADSNTQITDDIKIKKLQLSSSMESILRPKKVKEGKAESKEVEPAK